MEVLLFKVEGLAFCGQNRRFLATRSEVGVIVVVLVMNPLIFTAVGLALRDQARQS